MTSNKHFCRKFSPDLVEASFRRACPEVPLTMQADVGGDVRRQRSINTTDMYSIYGISTVMRWKR